MHRDVFVDGAIESVQRRSCLSTLVQQFTAFGSKRAHLDCGVTNVSTKDVVCHPAREEAVPVIDGKWTRKQGEEQLERKGVNGLPKLSHRVESFAHSTDHQLQCRLATA